MSTKGAAYAYQFPCPHCAADAVLSFHADRPWPMLRPCAAAAASRACSRAAWRTRKRRVCADKRAVRPPARACRDVRCSCACVAASSLRGMPPRDAAAPCAVALLFGPDARAVPLHGRRTRAPAVVPCVRRAAAYAAPCRPGAVRPPACELRRAAHHLHSAVRQRQPAPRRGDRAARDRTQPPSRRAPDPPARSRRQPVAGHALSAVPHSCGRGAANRAAPRSRHADSAGAKRPRIVADWDSAA